MNIEKIKDVVTARLKYIANCAVAIESTARACEKAGDIDGEAISTLWDCANDIGVNLNSLSVLLNNIEPKEETDK